MPLKFANPGLNVSLSNPTNLATVFKSILVVQVVSTVVESKGSNKRRSDGDVVISHTLDGLLDTILEESSDGVLLKGRAVLGHETVHSALSLPPLVETISRSRSRRESANCVF